MKRIPSIKIDFALLIVTVASILFSVAASLINLHRLWQYDLGYYDFGMFAVPIWKVSRFTAPVIDHFNIPGKINFADHFNPSIFLLTPLHWITGRIEILLIAQSMLVGASGIVLYLIGKKIIRNRFLSLSVVCAYFLFTGLQNAVYSDFHELTVMVFFLTTTYWAILTNRKKTFLLFFMLTLGFKESLFQLGIGISFFIFIYQKSWRRTAIFCLLYSIAWGYGAMSIIRYLNGGQYYYAFETDPRKIAVALVQPPIKIKTVLWSLVSFAGLPLFAPSLWPALLLHYAHRFATEGGTRWDLGLHYNAEVAPTLAIGTILGIKTLQSRLPKNIVHLIGCVLIGTGLFSYRIIFHGPLGLAYNPAFYAHTKDFKFLDKLVAKVPPTGRISAQNNLTPSFFHRDIRILRDNYRFDDPEYIVIDARDGQNPNNYLGVKDIKMTMQKLSKDPAYKIYYHDGDQYIFKKL